MHFLKKLSLNKKMSAIAQVRNEKTTQMIMSGKTAPVFGVISIYLGLFYESVSNDPNTRDVFNALVASSLVQIMHASKILAFWFIWSLDLGNLAGNRFINLDETKKDFSEIWNMHISEIERLTNFFDSLAIEKRTIALWDMFISGLNINDISSIRGSFIFAMPHLKNAQTDHLEQVLATISKS